MNAFFIYYNNGYFESSDKMNITLLHMIDTGVVKIIVNTKEGKAWIRGEEGTTKEVKIPEISGL
jgi:hypothetical protein